MTVLFNFERFNDPYIDAKLLDVLIAIKAELIYKANEFEKEIANENQAFVIEFMPSTCGITSTGFSKSLSNKLQPIADSIDFGKIVKRIVYANRN